MQNALETMKAIRALIGDEDKWCKGVAEREDGVWTVPTVCDAAKWSINGALQVVTRAPELAGQYGALSRIIDNYCSVLRPKYYFASGYFNDDPRTTHADVVSFLDEMIDMESANPGGLDGEYQRRVAADRERLGLDRGLLRFVDAARNINPAARDLS